MHAQKLAQLIGALVVVVLTPSQAGDLPDSSRAWTVLNLSIGWERRWYGSYYGQSCIMGSWPTPVRVHWSFQSDVSRVGNTCATGAAVLGQVKTFTAYIEGSNTIFAGTIEPYTTAQVVAGGSESKCALDEDDVQRAVDELRNQPARLLLFNPSDSAVGSEPLTTDSAGIREFVARSVAAANRNGSRISFDPSAKLLVGEWRVGDPYIIVGDQRKGPFGLLAIPDHDLVVDKTFCGDFVTVDLYEGRDRDGAQRRERVRRLLKSRFFLKSQPLE